MIKERRLNTVLHRGVFGPMSRKRFEMPESRTPMDSSQKKLLLFIGAQCDELGQLSQAAGDDVLRENASDRETLTYLYNRGLINAKTLLGGVVRPLGLTTAGQQALAELKVSDQT